MSAREAYLVVGAGGMLGSALQRVLVAHSQPFVALAERDLDVTDPVAVSRQANEFRTSLAPDVSGTLINAAAYTNVESAEDEPELAYLVNAQGPANLARAARASGLAFVHVSTDFVFDGCKSGPYLETDEPNPLSVYGASKLQGERAVLAENPDALVVRTAWVFGPAGVNFPVKILDAARSRATLAVVTDECGSPTYTVDLAAGLIELVNAGAHGLYHLAGAGTSTRFELAREVLALAGRADVLVEPVTSSAFASRVSRPANSVLDCGKAARLGVRLRDWHESLRDFVVGDLKMGEKLP